MSGGAVGKCSGRNTVEKHGRRPDLASPKWEAAEDAGVTGDRACLLSWTGKLTKVDLTLMGVAWIPSDQKAPPKRSLDGAPSRVKLFGPRLTIGC